MQRAEKFETAFECRGAFSLALLGKVSSRGRCFPEPQRRCGAPLRENRIDWFDGEHSQEEVVSVAATHFVYVHTDAHTTCSMRSVDID